MKNIVLVLCLVLSINSSVYAENDKERYLNSTFTYNISKTPNFLNRTFISGGNSYYLYYKNNLTYYLNYSRVKRNISYKGGFSLESFSMISDTAIGDNYCGNQNGELKIFMHGIGQYFCVVNGIELFPFNKFHFISFGFDLSFGYSRNASKFKDVIGCYGSTISKRQLFLGSSINLNGYIPIFTNWDLNINFRYQLRGDHVDFFTHVNYGFGVGVRYKLK